LYQAVRECDGSVRVSGSGCNGTGIVLIFVIPEYTVAHIWFGDSNRTPFVVYRPAFSGCRIPGESGIGNYWAAVTFVASPN
jgi:hypothetical protein